MFIIAPYKSPLNLGVANRLTIYFHCVLKISSHLQGPQSWVVKSCQVSDSQVYKFHQPEMSAMKCKMPFGDLKKFNPHPWCSKYPVRRCLGTPKPTPKTTCRKDWSIRVQKNQQKGFRNMSKNVSNSHEKNYGNVSNVFFFRHHECFFIC